MYIHFGQRHTVGGIVVWLCQTVGPNGSPAPAPVDPIAITPLCPAEGTVTGTITPGEVLAQTAQGIAAGEFEEVVRALRSGAAYANVHSSLFGAAKSAARSATPTDIETKIKHFRSRLDSSILISERNLRSIWGAWRSRDAGLFRF